VGVTFRTSMSGDQGRLGAVDLIRSSSWTCICDRSSVVYRRLILCWHGHEWINQPTNEPNQPTQDERKRSLLAFHYCTYCLSGTFSWSVSDLLNYQSGQVSVHSCTRSFTRGWGGCLCRKNKVSQLARDRTLSSRCVIHAVHVFINPT